MMCSACSGGISASGSLGLPYRCEPVALPRDGQPVAEHGRHWQTPSSRLLQLVEVH